MSVCICTVDMPLEFLFFFFKQKTAYEVRISDWSSDVCSSDLDLAFGERFGVGREAGAKPFALRDVEHGKAFEEGNRLGVAAGFGSAGLFGLGDEAVGIDDGGSTLALPDR